MENKNGVTHVLSLNAKLAASVMVEDCAQIGALPKPTLRGVQNVHGMPADDATNANSFHALILVKFSLHILQP